MTWLREHQRIWRTVILFLLVVSFMGPWTGDRISVPAEYDCSGPYIRTEGDMCDMIGFVGIIVGFLSMTGSLIEGTLAPADLLRSLLFTGSYFLYILPVFSTFFLLLFGERQFKLTILTWSLAIITFIFWSVIGAFPPSWMWGLRFYVGVAIGALALELLAFLTGMGSELAGMRRADYR